MATCFLMLTASFNLVSDIEPITTGAYIDKTVTLGQASIIALPPINSYPAPLITWYDHLDTSLQGEFLRSYVTLDNELVLLSTDMT